MTIAQVVPTPYEEQIRALKEELSQYEKLMKNNPEKARQEGRERLVRIGLIDRNGKRLEPYR